MHCPICAANCLPLGAVDFNKCCNDGAQAVLPRSGVAISYVLCEQCRFCFAPEFASWSLEDFETKVYNAEYVLVDPDYVDARPRANATSLLATFGDRGKEVRHLDYGGGSGLLSERLREKGWQSTSYDPFVDRAVSLSGLGRFDLVTAYEVFEHVPDVRRLIADLASLLNPEGVVLFSTLLSDGNVSPWYPLTWWYAAPRNGHISLFSAKSLAALGAIEGFSVGSFSQDLHAYWKEIPAWAAHILRQT
jgi:SAM-dependent methyltransferase